MEISELVELVKKTHGTTEWNVAEVIRIGGVLAAKVNAIKELSGKEKGKLVADALKVALDELEKNEAVGLTEENLKALKARFDQLKAAVDDVLPASLELAISAARGGLDLKKVKPSFWVHLGSCCAKAAVSVLVKEKLISEETAKKAADAVETVATVAAAAVADEEKPVAAVAAVADEVKPVVVETQSVAQAAASDIASAFQASSTLTNQESTTVEEKKETA
jgi:hypothetical protein